MNKLILTCRTNSVFSQDEILLKVQMTTDIFKFSHWVQ